MNIAILGAGNWGTTVAIALDRLNHDVTLWEYDQEQARLLQSERENRRFLPGYRLPDRIQISNDLETAVSNAEICVLAVPFQTSRSVLKRIGSLQSGMIVLSLMKGIEQGRLRRGSEICLEELRNFDLRRYAALSGPTIAPEVASGLPTSAVVASVDRGTAEQIQTALSSKTLRLYTSEDLVGVELAGALKNVMALAAGMCDGMKLGVNTKGALITRGLAEMMRLGTTLGGNAKTFSGLSGLGDLVTTCTSPASRNRTVGEAIGRGEKPQIVLSNMVMVAEGVWTARAARDLSRKHSISMPITEAVCRVLDGETEPHAALTELMLRDLKAED